MSIFVGNTLTFRLEEVVDGGFNVITPAVEIVRREFNSDDYDGVGYQRVFIQDNFGKTASHGIGSNQDFTALQIEAVNFALPLYRFDFSFNLSNSRLKLLYELYLVLYNKRAQGDSVRIRMTDQRLYISEPLDDDSNQRDGTIIGTTIEQTNQLNLGYSLKEVQYLISWENFEWAHLVGDFYTARILGTEIEVESDKNQGNVCFPASEEVVLDFEGLNAIAIPIPSNLQQGGVEYDCFGIGRLLGTPNQFFGHFLLDGAGGIDNYFVAWQEGAPGINGDTFIFFEDLFSGYDHDLITNTQVKSNKITFLSQDTDTTLAHVREFRPADTDTFSIFRETNKCPLLYHGLRSLTEEWQQPIVQQTNGVETNTVLIPRKVIRPSGFINNPVNEFRESLELGGPNSQFRMTVGEFGLLSGAELSGGLCQLNGAATVETVSQTGLLGSDPDPNRSFSINLSGGLASADGGWFLNYALNIINTTNISVSFEMRMEEGGDGIAFVIHNDSRMTIARGGSGANIGFGGFDGINYVPSVAIQPSIAVVFDTKKDGPAYGEPSGGAATPHFVRVIKDGRMNAAGQLGSAQSTYDLTSGAYRVVITYTGLTSTITVNIEPLLGGVIETFNFTGINIATQLSQSSYFLGFTSGTSGVATSHRIDRFQLNHDSFWYKDTDTNDPTERSLGEYYNIEEGSQTLVGRSRTFMGTQTDDVFTDIVTIQAPVEGNSIFYHIFRDRDNSAVTRIYKTTNPNPWDISGTLISSLDANECPPVERGIQSPQNQYKFYFTQGSNSGNVYSTIDWSTFNLIGSWDEKDATLENEGQLYWWLNRYLVRSPSRFVLDSNSDSFVDLRDLLCPALLGTAVDTDLFGTGRELITCFPTPQYIEAYDTAGQEQLIVVSRRAADKADMKIYSLVTQLAC